jgi:hypothetical protein
MLRKHEIGHVTGSVLELSDEYKPSDITSLGPNIVLRSNQRIAVQALLDIEDNRTVHINGGRAKITTTGAVLSEPFGSGKTITILALIATRKIPAPRPCIGVSTDELARDMHNGNSETLYNDSKFTTRNNIAHKYAVRNASLLSPNLIFVSVGVFRQWVDAIKTLTTLKCYAVANVVDIEKLAELIKNGKIRAYDIVICKNGSTSRNVRALYCDGTATSNYIDIIGHVTRNMVWSRVIYDDFDVAKIKDTSRAINALFSIFVSTTKYDAPTNRNIAKKRGAASSTKQMYANPILLLTTSNRSLFNEFNVRSNKELIDKSIMMPKLTIREIKHINPLEGVVNLVLKATDDDTLSEAVNGDAFHTAARMIGINSYSVADIFKKLLGGHYDTYTHNIKLINTINEFLLEFDTVRVAAKEQYSTAHICETLVVPEYTTPTQYAEVRRDLKEAKSIAEEKVKKSKSIIDDIHQHARKGSCSTCGERFRNEDDERDVCIVKCCNKTVCTYCLSKFYGFVAIKGSQGNVSYEGSCNTCYKSLSMSDDVVFINRSFDISQLLDAEGTEEDIIDYSAIEHEDDEDVEHITQADMLTMMKATSPKLVSLWNIINNKTHEEDLIHCTEKVANVLEGTVDNPWPHDKTRKVLVFANFDESLEKVYKFLDMMEEPYMKLRGGAFEIAKTISEFHKNDCRVLIINSSRHCAGLNLQHCSSDIVFMHRIVNKYIEAQVCGRMMRIGREHNGSVYRIMYTSEFE